MKRTLLFLTVAAGLLFSNNIQAQVPGAGVVKKILPKFTVGVKLGANFQQMTGNVWDNGYKPGFGGGVFVGVTKSKIGVQGEVLVRSAKFDIKTSGAPAINTLSLDVPVLFQYKIVTRLWVQAGPQFSTLISAKQSGNDIKKNFNTTDFAAVVGVQAVLPFRITAGARYVLGMTNINNESVSGAKESWNNRSIQLYLGFRFL